MKKHENRYKKNPFGVYHILIRGMHPSLKLFRDDEDVEIYRNLLMQMMDDGSVILYSVAVFEKYCHLLVKEGSITIPEFKKKLGNTYHRHYTIKYNHSGSLFHDHTDTQSVMTRNFFKKCLRVMNHNEALERMVFQNSLDELEDKDYQDEMEVCDFSSKVMLTSVSSCLLYFTSELGYKGLVDFRTWSDERKRVFMGKAKEAGVSERLIKRFTELSYNDW